MSRPRVIINADDFGIAPGVNRGILGGFRDGVLTSTTMLVNLDYFEEAVAIARDNPDLPVGIHLSLLWGRPISDPARVPTLVDRDGAFPRSLGTLARRYFLGRLSPAEVELEFRTQIGKFLDQGLDPTHLDTHKHVHCLPGVMRALISVADELGIRRVRLPYENGAVRRPPGSGLSWKVSGKRNAIRLLCRNARTELERAGIRTTDHFVGLDYMEDLNARNLQWILTRVPGGVTEVMCHPGYADAQLARWARALPDREQELAGLCDAGVRECADARVELTHYGEL